MNVFLEQFSRELPANVHAVMILDQAGFHTAKALQVPTNVTLIMLPPYSPELNPTENLWHYLRSHYWSNRSYDDYAHGCDPGLAGCLLGSRSDEDRLRRNVPQRAQLFTVIGIRAEKFTPFF
jgi:transposase